MPAITRREDVALYGNALSEFVGGLSDLNRIRPAGTLPVFRKCGEAAISFQGRRLVTLVTRLASFGLGNIRIPEVFPLGKLSELTLVWKSVLSVGRLGCILGAVEPIQVVLLLRHPCGIIASRRQGVERRVMAPVSPAEIEELVRSPAEIARQIRGRTRLIGTFELEAYRWAVLNSLALDALSNHPGSIVVRYEDLCANTESVLRDILAGLGLAWDDQVDQFLRQSMGRTSSRFYGLYREESAIDRWRKSVPTAMADRVLEIISDTPAGRLYLDG